LEDYVKYAYKPLSQNTDENVIDSRTYRWIRPFLQQKVFEGVTSLSFISTWFQHISKIPKEKAYQKMPFNVNNVDASVAVNGLYGIASWVLSQPEKYEKRFNPEVAQLFDNTAELIEYILDKDLIQVHASSILLYYPSKYAFYYFVSRLVKLLEGGASLPEAKTNKVNKMAMGLFEKWGARLKKAMREKATRQLSALKQQDVLNGHVYFDDFLGLGDDAPIRKPEDRIFSTAMAFNALYNTWTVPLEGSKSGESSQKCLL
jgi:hypothetical protein